MDVLYEKGRIKKSCYNFMTMFGLVTVSQLIVEHTNDGTVYLLIHNFRVELLNATPWTPGMTEPTVLYASSGPSWCCCCYWILLESHLFHFVLFCHLNWYVYDNWMPSQSEFTTKLEFFCVGIGLACHFSAIRKTVCSVYLLAPPYECILMALSLHSTHNDAAIQN